MWLKTLDGTLFNLRFASRLHFNPLALAVEYAGEESQPDNHPWVYSDEERTVMEGAQENPVAFEAWCRAQIRDGSGLMDLIEYRTAVGKEYGEPHDEEEVSEWGEMLRLRLQASRERRTGQVRAIESWIALPAHAILNLDALFTIYRDESGVVIAATAEGVETRLMDTEGDSAGSEETLAWAEAMLDWIGDRLKERTALIDLDHFSAEIIMGEEV